MVVLHYSIAAIHGPNLFIDFRSTKPQKSPQLLRVAAVKLIDWGTLFIPPSLVHQFGAFKGLLLVVSGI